ncbi:mitogen-activated protein kinase spk1-like, partial [Penaeus monodon]|uniref:mitogen-activated protein kinase spk1-like n=1 Tax=Penaeus monodon TaxID=6687 RepID=UPI0018A778D0
CLSVLYAIAKRLQEIHEAGIIHGDFKPDNCLITFDEEGNPDAHIIDFGLSTKIGQRSTLSRGHREDWYSILKKRPWYAVETFTGLPLQPATDVVAFSFIVLYVAKKILWKCPQVVKLANSGL